MPVERRIELGDEDRRPPASRLEHGTREYPVETHREAKPPVDSIDPDFVPVPAREQAKVDGTFGVDAPYERRAK